MHNLRGRQFRDAEKESISECATLKKNRLKYKKKKGKSQTVSVGDN